jgi:hypothetical protein
VAGRGRPWQAGAGRGGPGRAGAGRGRRDDERDLVVTDQAGTVFRPSGVRAAKNDLVERMDHVTNGVLMPGDQPGNRRDGRLGRRRHDDQRTTCPYRIMLAAPDELLQLAAFVLGQPPGPGRLRQTATAAACSAAADPPGTTPRRHEPSGRLILSVGGAGLTAYPHRIATGDEESPGSPRTRTTNQDSRKGEKRPAQKRAGREDPRERRRAKSMPGQGCRRKGLRQTDTAVERAASPGSAIPRTRHRDQKRSRCRVRCWPR